MGAHADTQIHTHSRIWTNSQKLSCTPRCSHDFVQIHAHASTCMQISHAHAHKLTHTPHACISKPTKRRRFNTCIRMNERTCMCVYTSVRAHTYVCLYKYKHTNTKTHTHTHTQHTLEKPTMASTELESEGARGMKAFNSSESTTSRSPVSVPSTMRSSESHAWHK
jgi:hypothetical protein